ncbi:HdeD family acid-resistance protein [Granulosicoccus antarcticus]|nr:DUF308 domain-containing protein [Granulosicoccus antarcticus]
MKTLNAIPMLSDPETKRHLRNVGLVLSGLGVIAILIPQLITFAVEILLAWLLIVAGASGLLFSWRARGFLGWWYTGVTFLLTLILGLVFLVYPFSGVATMTLFLIALFALEGLASLWLSAQLRRTGVRSWTWMVFSGISSLALAVFIMLGWPGSAAWAIGLLIGVNLLTTGVSLVSIALSSQVAQMPLDS